MIEIRNVSMEFLQSKRFKDFFYLTKSQKVVKSLINVDLMIDEGDKVAFLGPNGAGKTTLLKLIGGLLYPTYGEINVNGYNTVHNNLRSRKSVGFVLNEERSFYWRLTAVQNLEFFGVLDNLEGDRLTSKVVELIGLVGLEGAKHKKVATYSSGMKQRLAIARGLLCDPKVLILDEPTRTLDPEAVIDVKNLIMQKIHENEKRTLIIATHRFDEAEELCNKVCIIRNGELISFKTIDEIRSIYGSVSQYYHSIMERNKKD
ncbi:ABC transporter ATP-binding protein [Pedobacter kyonggii]|uniref:ABC transporter ATP-binding protein n=1 Tax=Pedobacter kyonggii TaxID=1926871 RepID=A0A4Q9HGE3_9SPHI|nr:ABC transporter ATP-binding protein [Pedobacter kyonggii]TBO44303.1 ABC transporter ATP-binding protein [Pedobacter kyonggii]